MRKPVGEKVLVETIEEEKLASSIIEIPESVRDKYRDHAQEATILAMGPLAFLEEKERDAEYPQVGDKVAIARFAGYPLRNGEDKFSHRVISDTDITLIIGEDDD
jgi:co-chaperonin GroES (HSP10)